jgi:hypothetical protein
LAAEFAELVFGGGDFLGEGGALEVELLRGGV